MVSSVPKRPVGPRPIAALLGGDALGGVVDAARSGDRVLAALRRALPADLAAHLVGAQQRDAELLIVADGPAWATRLRFLEPELKAALDARTRRVVRRVVVRVGPPPAPPRPAAPPPSRPLSPAARAALEAGAAQVSDPRLAAALRRLARRR